MFLRCHPGFLHFKTNTMHMRVSQVLKHPLLWKLVGFVSSVVGLLSYALSSSFTHLFGKWSFFKIILYTVASFIICSVMLLVKTCKLSRGSLLKAHVGFLVLMLTSLYAFFYDKAVNGKPDIPGVISSAAFVFMLFSLSMQTELGLEVEMLNFFLGFFTLQLMKINLMLALAAAAFCYSLFLLRSSLDSRMETVTVKATDHIVIEIDSANNSTGFQTDYSTHRRQLQSSRKTLESDDGYDWIKYERKQVKGSENSRSCYKCTYPSCPTKKTVQRSLNGQINKIVHKSKHNHPKPHATRRNSSSASSHAIPASNAVRAEIPDESFGTQDYSSISSGDEDFEQSFQPDAKRLKMEVENEGIWAHGRKTVRYPRITIQTISVVDVLDDGYLWKRYGKKVVKGNPNKRNYFKCARPGCPVRKQVQRASSDPRQVITTYSERHNHDVPTHAVTASKLN